MSEGVRIPPPARFWTANLRGVNRKQQGDIGVAMAIAYYTREGCAVSVPLTDTTRYDLVVDRDGQLLRVQAKTTRYRRYSRYEVALRTHGGNQSWRGEAKYITADDCDLVFVYALNGDMWEVPVKVVEGRGVLNLGKLVDQYRVGCWPAAGQAQ